MDAIEAQQKGSDGRRSEPARGLEPKEGRLRAGGSGGDRKRRRQQRQVGIVIGNEQYLYL